MTVNWHDRSLAPERLWGRVYRDIVSDLARETAWFPTGSQAVSWFRKRREAVFEAVTWAPEAVRVKVSGGTDDRLPGLRLRVHRPRARHEAAAFGNGTPAPYVDVACRAGATTGTAF